METATEINLKHDLDMVITDDGYIHFIENGLTHDLALMPISTVYAEPVAHLAQPGRRQIFTTLDIKHIVDELLDNADDHVVNMQTITIDMSTGRISFDSNDANGDRVNIDVFTEHCLLCGSEEPLTQVDLLSDVSREIGMIDEQISRLQGERTRLTYVEDDIKTELKDLINQH